MKNVLTSFLSKITCIMLLHPINNWAGFTILGKKQFNLTILKALLCCSSSLSVIPELAASASRGSLGRVPIFELCPRWVRDAGGAGVRGLAVCVLTSRLVDLCKAQTHNSGNWELWWQSLRYCVHFCGGKVSHISRSIFLLCLGCGWGRVRVLGLTHMEVLRG